MLFKKLTLEEVLSSFTVAKDNYFAQKAILETIERNYDEVKRNYYMYKHYYEAALAEYARFGGRVYSEREIEARHKYAIAAQNYRNEESKLCNQQWVFKKAHKTYKRLRRLLEKKEGQEKNQPQ